MDTDQSNKIEAAVFRRLLAHLDERKDVQNIDLMNLAGFCRNCLSKWYTAACNEAGIEVDYEAARKRVYGMPYGDWKRKYQTETSETQQTQFAAQKPPSSSYTVTDSGDSHPSKT